MRAATVQRRKRWKLITRWKYEDFLENLLSNLHVPDISCLPTNVLLALNNSAGGRFKNTPSIVGPSLISAQLCMDLGSSLAAEISLSTGN